jgi:hypothetical protein
MMLPPRAVLRGELWSSSGMRTGSDCRLESCTPLDRYVQQQPGLDDATFVASLRAPH